jgi:hypothetical protein
VNGIEERGIIVTNTHKGYAGLLVVVGVAAAAYIVGTGSNGALPTQTTKRRLVVADETPSKPVVTKVREILPRDPNEQCIQSREATKAAMMEDSQVVKNMGFSGMFARLVEGIRSEGPVNGTVDTMLNMIREAGNPVTARDEDDIREKIAVRKEYFASLPSLYDGYFRLGDIRAISYDSSIGRVVCHVSYQIDYDLYRKWFVGNWPDQVETIDREMKVINDMRRVTNGVVVPGKTFSVQPDGKGGTALNILSND